MSTKLKGLIASQLNFNIDSYGLSAAERDTLRKETLDTALKQLERLPPVSPISLSEFENNTLVWGVKEGKAEVASVKISNAITSSRTYSKKLDTVDALAESLVDLARSDMSDVQFHHEVHNKLKGDTAGDFGYAIIKASLKLSVEADYDSLDTSRRNEIHAARQLMTNKEHFKSTVLREAETVLGGMMKTDASIAPALNLVRVNEEILSGLTRLAVYDERVVRRGVEAFDTEVPLKVVDLEEPPVEGEKHFLEQLRDVQKDVETLKKANKDRAVIQTGEIDFSDEFTTDWTLWKEKYLYTGGGDKGNLDTEKRLYQPQQRIKFPKPFREPPTVIVIPTGKVVQGNGGGVQVRVHFKNPTDAATQDIDKNGFALDVIAERGCRVARMNISYIAVGMAE